MLQRRKTQIRMMTLFLMPFLGLNLLYAGSDKEDLFERREPYKKVHTNEDSDYDHIITDLNSDDIRLRSQAARKIVDLFRGKTGSQTHFNTVAVRTALEGLLTLQDASDDDKYQAFSALVELYFRRDGKNLKFFNNFALEEVVYSLLKSDDSKVQISTALKIYTLLNKGKEGAFSLQGTVKILGAFGGCLIKHQGLVEKTRLQQAQLWFAKAIAKFTLQDT